jgi:hypothetical protein
VSVGVCNGGGTAGVVASRFGLAAFAGGAVICACADAAAMKISIAANGNLMTNPAGD